MPVYVLEVTAEEMENVESLTFKVAWRSILLRRLLNNGCHAGQFFHDFYQGGRGG